MTLRDCIDRAMGDDETALDADFAEKAKDRFETQRARYARDYDDATAAAMAAEDVRKAMRKEFESRRRRTLLQLATARRLDANIRQYRTLTGESHHGRALTAMFETDHVAGFDSVSSLRSSLRGFYHSMIPEALRAFGRNIVGETRNKALLRDVARGLHGDTVEGAAAELVEAIKTVMARARADYNAAGGDLGLIEDYGLPHSHDAARLLKKGPEEWKAAIRGRLDWSRIVDPGTELPFAGRGLGADPKQVDAYLDEVYRTLTSEGWSARTPSFAPQGAGDRSARHRSLHFKSGEDWLAYNAAFGRGDPWSALMTHLDGMARDTALMRVFGPNVAGGLEFAIQTAKKAASETPSRASASPLHSSMVKEVDSYATQARVLMDLTTGAANQPVNDQFAGFMAGTRQVLVSAQLGGAMLSAVSDAGFQYMAARQIGMDPGGVVKRMTRLMASSGARAEALRMGVIADSLANVGSTQARFAGEAWAPEITERLSDFVMRASGLSAWTDYGRHAFQLEFMGFLADHVAHQFDELPKPLAKVLGQRGVTPQLWDQMRRMDLHLDESGASFLVPAKMRRTEGIDPEQADFLALKLQSIIHEQTEFAVPSATLRGRAAFTGGLPPGNLIGELARSGLMYKSFGISLMYNQFHRVMALDGPISRAVYLAKLGAVMTAMGWLSMNMKEVAKGRDPKLDMHDPKVLGAAFLQGGGVGIFGDFLFASENRFGGSLEKTLVGPAFGVLGDVASLGMRAAQAPFGDNDTLGRAGVDFLRKYTPGASLWYGNLAWQRLVMDELQRAVDPRAERSFRARERRRQRENGTASWWALGQSAPSRAPWN